MSTPRLFRQRVDPVTAAAAQITVRVREKILEVYDSHWLSDRASIALGMVDVRAPIQSDPEILSGTLCFSGTRVPVATLLDYLKAGDRIDDFLDDFPTVTREQIAAVLEIASEAVSHYARSA